MPREKENFHLDTELFLALVIGPLLFREAERSRYSRFRLTLGIILVIFPVDFYLNRGWAGRFTRCGWVFRAQPDGSWGSAGLPTVARFPCLSALLSKRVSIS